MSSSRPGSRRPSGQPRGNSRSSAAAAARRRQASVQRDKLNEEQRAAEDAKIRAERRRRAEEDVRQRAEKTRRVAKKPVTPGPRQPRQGAARPANETRVAHVPGTPVDPRFTRRWNIVYGTGEATKEFPVRFLVILAFAAIALLIVATPLTQYMAQQEEKREVIADLEDTQERVTQLEQEIARWEDPQFVQSQARERLGYVMPGQTLYLVADPDEGTAEQRLEKRVDEVNRERRAATPFYVTMLDSISIAGAVGASNPSDVPIIEDLNAPELEPPGEQGTSESPTVVENDEDHQ